MFRHKDNLPLLLNVGVGPKWHPSLNFRPRRTEASERNDNNGTRRGNVELPFTKSLTKQYITCNEKWYPSLGSRFLSVSLCTTHTFEATHYRLSLWWDGNPWEQEGQTDTEKETEREAILFPQWNFFKYFKSNPEVVVQLLIETTLKIAQLYPVSLGIIVENCIWWLHALESLAFLSIPGQGRRLETITIMVSRVCYVDL